MIFSQLEPFPKVRGLHDMQAIHMCYACTQIPLPRDASLMPSHIYLTLPLFSPLRPRLDFCS